MHLNGRTFADINEIASSFDHFLNVFSIMVSPISMKLSDVIQDKICKKKHLHIIFWSSLPVPRL